MTQVTKAQLDALERAADKVFGRLGIDIEFTRHFLDRANDERNGDPISIKEIGMLFAKEYKRWGNTIAKMPIDAEAVMKDLSTELNIPFVLNKDGNEKDLVAKTIMRKKNFKSPDPELPVESAYAGPTRKQVKQYAKDKNAEKEWYAKHKAEKDAEYDAWVKAGRLKKENVTEKGRHRHDPNDDAVDLDSMSAMPGGEDPGAAYDAVERQNAIQEILPTLDHKLQKVIELRFGLNGEEPHTLKQVAKIFKVGPERIRQIEAKAMRQLKHPSRSRSLRPFYEDSSVTEEAHSDDLYYVQPDGSWEKGGDGRAKGRKRNELPKGAKIKEEKHGARRGTQVKGTDAMPKKQKAGQGPSSPHPMRGKLVGEEAVNEISNKTRGEYIKKAQADRDQKWKDSKDERSHTGPEGARLRKIAAKRSRGIDTAISHMKKESMDQAPLDVATPGVEQIADKHGVSVEMIDAQLEKGVQIEMEHTSDMMAAMEIALDHLAEMPDYYTRLADMEGGLHEMVTQGAWECAQLREKIQDPREAILNKALNYLDKMVQARGSKQDVGGYAFDIARSFDLRGIATAKELANLYHKWKGTEPHGGRKDVFFQEGDEGVAEAVLPGTARHSRAVATYTPWKDGIHVTGKYSRQGKGQKLDFFAKDEEEAIQILINKLGVAPERIKLMPADGVNEGNPCWDGYEKVPGKKDYEKGSCRKKTSEAGGKIACLKCDEVSTAAAWQKRGNTCPKCKKSSQGVAENVELDEKEGGMSDKERKAYNRKHGTNLKRAQPGGGKRRTSYCARSKGQMDMHNIDCRKDPDKPICKARRDWNC